MNKTLVVVALLLATACSAPKSPPDEIPDVGVTALESSLLPWIVFTGEPVASRSLAERMEELRVPGVSVAVIEDGALAWARGFGTVDVETGRPVTTESLFQAASISKPVAALLALRSVQDGRIALDDDVNTKLTSWQVPGSALTDAAPVTLRGLLSHSAGTTVHGFPGYARAVEQPSAVGVLDGHGNTDAVRVDVRPGTIYRYSGGGYTVMQQLMSDLYGRPFSELMSELVLDPIGMAHSTYVQPLPEPLWDQAATGYRRDGSAVEGRWHVYPEMAAAGLWTTPSDLARYALEVQKAAAGRSDAVIGPAMAEKMLRPVLGGHGLGPGIDEASGRFGHGGANAGFRCNLTATIDGRWGVVVMTNGDAGGEIAREVLMTLVRAYGWDGPQPEERTLFDMDEAALRAFAGTYEVPNYGNITISTSGDRLSVRHPNGRTDELRPISATRFLDPGDGQQVEFVFEGGEVTGATIGTLTIKRVG